MSYVTQNGEASSICPVGGSLMPVDGSGIPSARIPSSQSHVAKKIANENDSLVISFEHAKTLVTARVEGYCVKAV
jgi:hypothetical protein